MAPRLLQLAAVCSVMAAAAAALGAGRSSALSTSELLVNLARDQGLNRRGSQTPGDVEQIEILLKSAARLNPRLPEAHTWLYELATLRGDEQAAFEAIARLVAADPTNVGAFARWLEAGMQVGQTIEQRQEWLQSLLADPTRPPEMLAMVHVQLARLALASLNRPRALQELNQALALNINDPDAAALRFELLDPEASPTERLRVALHYLQLSPLHVDTAWEIGLLLDQLGWPEEAEPFLQHAREIYALSKPGAPLPSSYALEYARHLVARGEFRSATELVEQVLAADPGLLGEAGILYYWLLTRQGRPLEAAQNKTRLAEKFAAVREPGEWPADELAQAAWFYCTIDSQPQRALMLAEAAAQRVPGDRFVKRVLGWAQAASLKYAEAVNTLAPIAREDALAAYQLANVLKQQGDEAAAVEALRRCLAMPPAGPAHELIENLGLPQPATQPTAQRLPDVAAALATFNRTVLLFHKDPARYLRAEIEPEDRSPGPGEPWWATFSLTNTADFAITFGPELMVNPIFLLSVDLEGQRKRSYPDLLTIAVDRVRVLVPGMTVRVRRTLDLGPPRQVLRSTPQHLERVTIHALLDPVQGPDRQWRPGLGGQALRPVYLNRVPAQVSAAALRVLFGDLASDVEPERLAAIELMAELLGERQRADLGRLSYQPDPIPADRIEQALLAVLADDSPELRARGLDALQSAGLDERLFAAVQGCLGHPHWLVRLMAVRLVGERKAQPALPTLREMAASDADELVRALAQTYLPAGNPEK